MRLNPRVVTTNGNATSSAAAATVTETAKPTADISTGALLGIITATLVAVAILIIGTIMLIAYRRRRRRGQPPADKEATQYPSKLDPTSESEKQQSQPEQPQPQSPVRRQSEVPSGLLSESSGEDGLTVGSIMSFDSDETSGVACPSEPDTSIPCPSTGASPSRRIPSSSLTPPSAGAPIPEPSSSRRTAFLNAQLEKLSTEPERDADTGSMRFNPLSSLPSATPAVARRSVMFDIPPPSPRLLAPSQQRDTTAYLATQMAKLDRNQAPRKGNDTEADVESITFSPLSRVPSLSASPSRRAAAPPPLSSVPRRVSAGLLSPPLRTPPAPRTPPPQPPTLQVISVGGWR
ncbi:hypothetical protein HMN09_01117700 [Mycena chlorophos]|uniref:Uncharacterized protein n=1 Tax=Mycena chlorophos TaxID=658473 RepID=A0A8H6SCD8_MYCCL|nr:hypothetical protein HMN09_01117700 [Mycena chlorophos]